MKIKTVGSVCSGIEAASVAWEPLGLRFEWFSEIADFPSRVLAYRYPNIKNLGDMTYIPAKINEKSVSAPDLICGGTPCQAFSFAGLQNGLNDDRGNLTLKFVDIIESNDFVRLGEGKERTVVFWENVEGVLSDKTNAFGCLVSSLAGLENPIEKKKWPSSGFIYGPKRNVAWRVLDAKYFGLPHQRRRLYVMAGGNEFHPEDVLFERHENKFQKFPNYKLTFEKDGHQFEIFREYTDCLYSSYGTKWNGNAAATNGSLFVVQDGRIRRLSPLETERLMGFPDNYTNIPKSKKTNRYQAIGNSWAVPVVRWLGSRFSLSRIESLNINVNELAMQGIAENIDDKAYMVSLGRDVVTIGANLKINATPIPENSIFGNMRDIVSPDVPEDIYISPVGCFGIVRRKRERNLKINARLEEILLDTASQMSAEEIEKRSRVQKRGRFSDSIRGVATKKVNIKTDAYSVESNVAKVKQLSIFDF
ncbi:DNA cytosine methyltransferase [uncultured Ligilactobacillus sp.]|uniref:DNA cytosine methyltransferase n=1 Tax=uncultured Ligilactobacillus sp. TaxID=2837633 RepID=UPI002590B4F3|nr:DNA cytosine methyltransferase [uncultured Ligilactobacillus sp.]